jgi:hypothetical protein
MHLKVKFFTIPFKELLSISGNIVFNKGDEQKRILEKLKYSHDTA